LLKKPSFNSIGIVSSEYTTRFHEVRRYVGLSLAIESKSKTLIWKVQTIQMILRFNHTQISAISGIVENNSLAS
jgi:hypothetical protein